MAKNNKKSNRTKKSKNEQLSIGDSKSSIFSKLSFLKQKKIWIPLIIGHLLMFTGMGYFSIHQATKVNKANYVISSLKESFENNDPVLFNSIVDINSLSEHFVEDFVKAIPNYNHLYVYMGEIPTTESIKDHLSLFLLDTIRGNEYQNEFYKKTKFIPTDIVQQIINTDYDIVRTDETDKYKLIATFYDPKWETITIKFELKQTPDGLKISKILNLDEILQVYNAKLAKDHQTLQNNKTILINRELNNINKYINNPKCAVQLGEIASKRVLFIELTADPNSATSDVVSFSTNILIKNSDNEELMQSELKSNKLFLPNTPIQTSWNIELNDEIFQKLLSSQELFCSADIIMVNAANGDYYDIRKK